MLNNLCRIAAATGATLASGAANNIDTTSVTTAIASLNTGFTVTHPDQLNPPSTPASYSDERRPADHFLRL